MMSALRAVGRGIAAITLGLAVAPGAPLLIRSGGRSESEPRFDKPDAGLAFWAKKRAPIGQAAVPAARYLKALGQTRQMRVFSSATNSFKPGVGRWDGQSTIAPEAPNLQSWTPLGPTNISGRTRAILFDPSFGSNQTMYAGAVAGGVWKSTDAGTSWSAIGDSLANVAVNSLAMSPTNSTLLLAGTGEGFDNLDARRGAGIFKTTDGGATWAQLASTNNSNFYYVNRIAFSVQNTADIYAATGTGIWQSTDTGGTWTQILNPGTTAGTTSVYLGCTDVVVRNDQPNDWVVAACGQFSQAYVLTNQSALTTPTTWSQAALSTSPIAARTSLAIAPTDQTYVYALASTYNGSSGDSSVRGVYLSTDGGTNWTAQHNYADSGAASAVGDLLLSGTFTACSNSSPTSYSQGWYDQYIAVDPTLKTRVFTSGVQLFRSTDSGVTWGSLEVSYGAAIHPDEHVIAFPPNYDASTNKSFYVGNDGGIYRVDDATQVPTTSLSALCNGSDGTNTFSFTKRSSGYAATQYYYGAVYPNNTTYFGGSQDNGTSRGTDAGGASAWSTIWGGDGGDVAVDPNNTNNLYVENYSYSIYRSTDGGSSFVAAGSSPGNNDPGFLFIVPFTMDPTTTTTLWTGGSKLWRTTDGAVSWTQASTQFSSDSVSAIAVSPTTSNHVLVGGSGGHIFRNALALSASSSTTWSSALPVSGGYVSSIAFKPGSNTIAYATYSTFGVGHVWRTNDGGATWTNIASGFPDVPALSVVVDSEGRLFVGTDLGVYTTSDDGAHWYVENTGFGNFPVDGLVLNGSTLYAFTHGRGVWRVPLVINDVSIDNVSLTEGNSGTQNAVFTVTLSQAATGNESVEYATSNGTATAGSDYTATSGTLTFAAGTSTQTLAVVVNGDTLYEADETFNVVLSHATDCMIVDGNGVGTILNDDPAPALSLAGDVSLNVGASGTNSAVFTVNQSAVSGLQSTVHYATADGTASAGTDYVATAGDLTFAPGATTQTFAVVVNGDASYEAKETFSVTLSNPVNATLGTSTASGTITSTVVPAGLSFSAPTYTVSEAAGAATIMVKRTGGLAPASVVYATSDGSASQGSDYTATSGVLSFAQGVLARTFKVPVTDDAIHEPSKTVLLRLHSPGGSGVLAAPSTAVLTITDDDPWSIIQFAVGGLTVKEAAGTANVVVHRLASTAGTSTVDYTTVDGTAVAGSDYTLTSGTLTFGPGVSFQTIAVPITDDPNPEPSETFSVVLSNPGTAVLGTLKTSKVTILDDDQGLAFASSAYTVAETVPKAVITVKRTGGTSGTLSVDYDVTGGTAVLGTDYNFTSGTLSFGPGVASRTFAVNLVNTPADEGSRTVVLSLLNAVPATALEAPTTTTLTITDKEPVFRFAAPQYSVAESVTKTTVTVLRTGSTALAGHVDYVISGGTAVDGTDYNLSSGTLSFGPGQATRTFTISILDDMLDEPNETVVLQLQNGTLPIGTPGTSTVTIVNKETAGTVALSSALYSVVEGGGATITVKRSGGTSGGATIQYATSDGSATVAAGDYTAASGTLTFNPGETTKTFTVAVADDGIAAGNKTVNLTLSAPGGGLLLGTPSTATLWIVDAEGP
jgi:hypothetical protein